MFTFLGQLSGARDLDLERTPRRKGTEYQEGEFVLWKEGNRGPKNIYLGGGGSPGGVQPRCFLRPGSTMDVSAWTATRCPAQCAQPK